MSDPSLAPETESPPQPSSRLFQIALGLSLAGGVYCAATTRDLPFHHLLLGLAIYSLSVFPILRWAKEQRRQIPFFEIFSLTLLSTYSLPLLRESGSLAYYPEETITRAAWVVLVFQLCLIGTHLLTQGQPGRGPFYETEVLGEGTRRLLSLGLSFSTLHSFISIFTELIPSEINSVLRAICAGIGMVAIFALSKDLGSGTLPRREKHLFLLCTSLLVIFNSSSLLLISGISILVLGSIGYISGSRRLPLVFLACAIPLLAILHNGKQTLRDKYWNPVTGERRQTPLLQLPDLYVEWFKTGLTQSSHSGGEQKPLTGKLLDRGSLMHMACLVVDCTPYRQPYLDGETYRHIPSQFIPRVFWPDKPSAHIATNRLAVYYGLQNEDSTNWTTIGFGVIPEAYANFGMLGVAFLGALFGFLYKKVAVLTQDSPLLSYAGLFVVILTAWSFQTEFTLSIWLSSFFQACVAVILIPMGLRKLLG